MRVYRDDQKFLSFRINAVLWGIVAIFLFLAGSFWFVQGVQADKYRGLSEANALREIVMPAKRGLTLDRTVMRPLVKSDPQHRPKLITFLASVLGLTPQEIEARFEKGKLIPFAR